MTQEQLKQAILKVASNLEEDKSQSYKALFEAFTGYPAIVRELVWAIFVNNTKVPEDENIALIKEYAWELHTYGYYIFD